MSFSDEFLRGIVCVFKITSPPLFRYPYRNSAEAFRGDWKHIGKDIEASMRTFTGSSAEADDE